MRNLVDQDALDKVIRDLEMVNDFVVDISTYDDEGHETGDDLYIHLANYDEELRYQRKKLIDLLRGELEVFGDEEHYKHEMKREFIKPMYGTPEEGVRRDKMRFLLALLVRAHDEWSRKYKDMTEEELNSVVISAVSEE